jgi:hypothetical protein
MTAPTPPTIIQQPGFGQQLQQSLQPLLAALQMRQQLGMQKQKLELERQRTEAQIAQAGAATAESRGRHKERLAKLEQDDINLRAQDYATQQYIALATGAEGVTAETVRDMQEVIIKQGDKDISSEALNHFNVLVKQDEESRSAVAIRRQQEVAAQVAEETERAQVERTITDAERAQVGLSIDKQQEQLMDIELRKALEGRDPARVNAALAAYRGGNLTWKQARETVGLPPGGIPDDAVYSPLASGANAEYARKASNFALQMWTSANRIDELIEQTGGITALASIQRQTRSALLDVVINQLVSPEQRQLVNAHRVFGDAFRFFVSGQQSSDKEAMRILNSVAEQTGDDEGTKRQKRLMRRTMIQAAMRAASGESSPEQAMRDVVDRAKEMGFSKKTIDIFNEQLEDAKKYTAGINSGVILRGVSSQPTTPANLNLVMESTDSLMSEIFEVR